jgi:SEC-C motif domain protein
MSNCMCGSGREFDECCAPLLAGAAAPTAEALMRSRYSAYTLGQFDHIERTDAPEARADFNRAEVERSAVGTTWLGLKVVRVVAGGVDDQTGQVEFIFRYRQHGKTHAQHELSQFRRENGVWLYESSEMNPKAPPLRVSKINRNDPCRCGSGKKYKKCCGAA